MTLKVPNLGAAAIDLSSGAFLFTWTSFFRAFAAGAAPVEAVTVAASPFAYKALGPGEVLVSGGESVTVTLTRGRVTISVPDGFVPVATGDVVSVGFTAPPTLSFIPRVV